MAEVLANVARPGHDPQPLAKL
jgi:hypothetical protein